MKKIFVGKSNQEGCHVSLDDLLKMSSTDIAWHNYLRLLDGPRLFREYLVYRQFCGA